MDKELLKRIERTFAYLNSQSAAGSFPGPGALATLLSQYVDPSVSTKTISATRKIQTGFATAAVEMWLRAVHSFLISLSLSKASPAWASISGYYSSHYSVRAFAHLFGTFQLQRKHRIAYLEKGGGHLTLEKKNAGDREHKFYWKYVSEHLNDPFFYPNQEDQADGGHRNKINYWDHIGQYPVFKPLDAQFLRDAVERIAGIYLSSVPVPRADANPFPDLDNVQIIAYHRLVKFRKFLDGICEKNRFWSIYRNPSWRPCSLRFNVVEPMFVSVYANQP